MEIEHRNEREFATWLRRLGAIERTKTAWELNHLIVLGMSVGMPHVRYLGDGLYELRVRMGQQPRLYFDAHGDAARMLTYGRKGTQERDIQRARGRMT
jgi:putative addiction module killer protein